MNESPQKQEELRRRALDALAIRQPQGKCAAVWSMRAPADVDIQGHLAPPPGLPGRPDRPELISPASLPRRSMSTVEGRAALLHALAHIEFNAINLALDIMWRFPGMPEQFYREWCRVAIEEATHFDLLARRLRALGYAYGDFPAHNGLWEMAEKTQGDLLARIALVPRTLEARGLDASPPIRRRLAQAGDAESAAILDVILRDEVGHVAIGNHWYKWLCAQEGRDPVATYEELAERYQAPRLRGPFNLEARRAAGFEEAELEALQRMAGQPQD
ncbi:ferritin-like domain-containing protein [Alcaligenaceae bacterium]|nr:ferritin-like domain-containing protein [Alcaligenaceae bacterium]